MKKTAIRSILIPGALLGLSGIVAQAAPVNCSTITTVAGAVNANAGGGCQIGNLVFSNFSFNFSSGTSNQNGQNPQTPPANLVGLGITDNGSGLYSVVTDFSNSEPMAAVTATNNMTFQLQYYVTETIPGGTITEIDGSAKIGVNLQPSGPSDATGSYTKNICENGAYADSGGPNPIPEAACRGSKSDNAVFDQWNSSNGAITGDPTTPGNQILQGGSETGISLTSAGVFDQVTLNGGSHDTPIGGQYQAALNYFENDFVETTPEPGTFLLMGGALIGLGFIRRTKTS